MKKNNELLTDDNILDICSEGKDVDEAVSELESLGTVKFVDEKIDDGCDDDCEDEYVMMRSYTVSTDDQDFYVKIYYGNNTRTVSYVDVTEE